MKRTILLICGISSLTGIACGDDEEAVRTFDGPVDIALLEPNEVIEVPVGFVTNFRSGLITKLDLYHDTPLRDRHEGSWLRSAPLATGKDRFLEQVEVVSYFADSSDYFVTLLASDALRDELLVVPYLDSKASYDPACIPGAAACVPGETVDGKLCGPETGFIPRFPVCLKELEGALKEGQSPLDGVIDVLGPEGIPSGYRLKKFKLKEGATTTETWTATYVDGAFLLNGSRSGVQASSCQPGETCSSDGGELSFDLVKEGEGALLEGTTFSLHTDSGIAAIPMPGTILDLLFDEETFTLYATVQSLELLDDGAEFMRGYLAMLDLEPLTRRAQIPVPDLLPLCPLNGVDEECPFEARPVRMELDRDRRELYIAESSDLGGVYRVGLESSVKSVEVLPDFGPNLDVAVVSDGREGGYRHLFVANLDEGTVSLYDVNSSELIDVNPSTLEVDPVRFYSPIQGIAASEALVTIPEGNDDQVSLKSILLGVTTWKGDLFAVKADSGCLMFATADGATLSSATFNDEGGESNPTLETDTETEQSVAFSACGGLTRSETWTFLYDEMLGAYKVRGSRSNAPGTFQRMLAYENQRYVSDGGEISVYIQSGTQATTDGDSFTIVVSGNVLPISVAENPSDLQTFTLRASSEDDAWSEVEFKTIAVVGASSSDLVYKVDLALPNLSGLAAKVTYQ